jgi:hypothetical protein
MNLWLHARATHVANAHPWRERREERSSEKRAQPASAASALLLALSFSPRFQLSVLLAALPAATGVHVSIPLVVDHARGISAT